MEALAAEVVLSALEDRHVHFAPERSRCRRHVLGQELFLECLRRRGDHNPQPGVERRDQVGKALPDTGTGLGEQMLPTLERVGHLLRERSLSGPRLEAGESDGQPPAGSEERAHEGG